MEWYYIVLIVIGGLVLLYCLFTLAAAIYVMKVMTKPYWRPVDKHIQDMIKDKRLKENELEEYYQPENTKIDSKMGYKLQVSYIAKKKDVKFADGKERVVILVHGWTSFRYAMLVYGKIYLDQGFHVFCYDHRNHGESDKKVTTMGNKEADDLQTVVEYVYEKMGKNIVLGTHGESMGSATAMTHAGRYHSVDFMVEDCGYNSLRDLLKYQCKELNHLPLFPTMQFGDLIFRLVAHTSYKEVEPQKGLSTCDDIPMYFVQGTNDTFVPSYMVYKCYDAKNGFKMIDTYKDSAHACSIMDYPEEYRQNLNKFLLEAKVIDKIN